MGPWVCFFKCFSCSLGGMVEVCHADVEVCHADVEVCHAHVLIGGGFDHLFLFLPYFGEIIQKLTQHIFQFPPTKKKQGK